MADVEDDNEEDNSEGSGTLLRRQKTETKDDGTFAGQKLIKQMTLQKVLETN